MKMMEDGNTSFFFEIAKKKLLNGKVKICIEKVKKLLKIFERLKMLKC